MAAQNSIDERGAAARQTDDEDGIVAWRRQRVRRALARRGRKCLHDPIDRRQIDRDVVSHVFPALLCALPQVLKRPRMVADVFIFLGEAIPNLNVAKEYEMPCAMSASSSPMW